MNIALFPTKRIGDFALNFILKNYPDDLKLIVFESDDSEIFYKFKDAKPYIFYKDIEENLDMISSLKLDWIFLTWWPHIVRKNLIDIPKKGVINTHNSLLPFNRGVHPNFWAIVEEKEYGVSIHKVTPGVDDGDLIAQTHIPYDWTMNGDHLYELGMVELEKLFAETYPRIRNDDYALTPQNHDLMTVRKTSEISEASVINLDKEYSARYLLNVIRAKDCLGKTPVYFEEDGKVYEVRIDIKESE